MLFAAPPALGGTPPADANCLGVVTAQRTVANHDIGEHTSSQEEPRLGLGSVAEEVLGDGAHRLNIRRVLLSGTPMRRSGRPSP